MSDQNNSDSDSGSDMEFGNEEMDDEEGLPILEEGDSSYTFCYQHAKSIPHFLIEHAKDIRHLDLSHNRFQDLFELQTFRELEHLILDNNCINNDTKFPRLPHLQTLQLNHNEVKNLAPFIRGISLAFPKLTCLSMLGNPACPGGSALTGLLKEDDSRDYDLYRCYTASRIKSLVFLDWKPLTAVERTRGYSIYKWSDFIPGAVGNKSNNDSSLVRVESAIGKTSKAHRVAQKYVGNRSEGNRFIGNDVL